MGIVGVSTACMYPMETELALQSAAEAGIRDFEIHFSTFSELDAGYLKQIRKMLRFYGCRVHTVHPFYSALESAMFFSDYSERRFADGLEIYRQYFEAAAYLGADYVVFHGGQNIGKARVLVSHDEYIARYNSILETGRRYGATLVHENVYTHIAQTPDFCRRMIDYLGDKALFVFDNKQARRAGISPEEFARAIAGHIAAIHISDSDREHDCLLPGRGRENLAALRDALRGKDLEAPWLIEVYNDAFSDPAALRQSADYLEGLLGGGSGVAGR